MCALVSWQLLFDVRLVFLFFQTSSLLEDRKTAAASFLDSTAAMKSHYPGLYQELHPSKPKGHNIFIQLPNVVSILANYTIICQH